jgi:hypothetical protein
MAKEKYYLYLDESGNFWEDDPSDKVSPSLIGGVLCQKELADESVAEKVHSNVVQSFINEYPQYINADFDHATEAVAAEDKPELKLRMVEAITKAGYIPVVFQQKDKYFIQTNTTTYIMFLVEGIIKLIEDRKIENLSVIIGERLDLDKKEAWLRKHPGVSEKAYKGPYILKKDIVSEYNKFMAIAKIREAYAFIGLKPDVKFDLADDKQDRLLILCDYVCNNYLTGSSFHNEEHKKRFRKLKRKSRTGRTADSKYQVYTITETKEAERLKRYTAERNYGEALFFCMTVEIDDEEFERAKNELTIQLSRIRGNDKKFLLDILYSKIGRLIQVERSLQSAIRIIDNLLLFFNEKIKWNSGEKSLQNEFFANLYLYKMAALTHMGDVKSFKKIADLCEHYVKDMQDINFFLMFKNRWVVDLQDVFQYEDSLELGKELLSLMDTYAETEKEIENKFGYKFSACLDQLPKVANSLALTAYFTLNDSHEHLEEARRYSDIAMQYFDGKEDDMARAYQTRVQIEAEAGNFAEAIMFLNKGLNIDFQNMSAEQVSRLKQFGWYHVTKILDSMIRTGSDDYKILGIKIIENCLPGFTEYKDSFLDMLPDENSKERTKFSDVMYPGYVNLCMMGSAMVNSGKEYLRDKGFALLEQAYNSVKNSQSPTFKMHSVVILFKMLSVCGPKFNSKRIPVIKEEIKKNVEFLNNLTAFSSDTPAMIKLNELCSCNFDKDTVEKGTRLVLM